MIRGKFAKRLRQSPAVTWAASAAVTAFLEASSCRLFLQSSSLKLAEEPVHPCWGLMQISDLPCRAAKKLVFYFYLDSVLSYQNIDYHTVQDSKGHNLYKQSGMIDQILPCKTGQQRWIHEIRRFSQVKYNISSC